MSSLFCTHLPSSVMVTTPASLSDPMGASSSPAIPEVMAPAIYTLTFASRRALSWINLTVEGVSMAGEVFGMQTTEVNPPMAAAAEPEAMSSLAVWPGSRKCTCRSISPGQTTCPVQSIISTSPEDSRSFPSEWTLPSERRTSAISSRWLAGSMTRPP